MTTPSDSSFARCSSVSGSRVWMRMWPEAGASFARGGAAASAGPFASGSTVTPLIVIRAMAPTLPPGSAGCQLIDVAVSDDRRAPVAPGRRDHEQRDQQADDADHHQDDSDGRDLEPGDRRVHGEIQD